jgi:hydrogenase/urease accessory protein HupE
MALMALLLTPSSAAAHVRATTGFSEISEQGGHVRYTLSLEYELLAATLGLGKEALEAEDDGEREAALAASRKRVDSYLERTLKVSLDGLQCPAELENTAVERLDGVPYAVVTRSYQCPGAARGGYAVTYGVFSDRTAVVDEHTNIVDYVMDDVRGQFVFDAGHRTLSIGQASWVASAIRFLSLGVVHIVEGADHVLFLVALLLGASGFRDVMKLALAFTAAHSVTLGLAALGWVDIPAQIVEPLIALSIAYVAADNLLGGGATRYRVPVTFGFGLLHGLGFASALTFSGDLGWQLLSSLLTFNLGVEIGQALIILALFPLLGWVRRRFGWSRLAHSLATAAIAVLGASWFFVRLTA